MTDKTQFRKMRDLDRKIIEYAGIFDGEFYRNAYPEIAEQNIDPLEHYLTMGEAENKRPNQWFFPELYKVENLRNNKLANFIMYNANQKDIVQHRKSAYSLFNDEKFLENNIKYALYKHENISKWHYGYHLSFIDYLKNNKLFKYKLKDNDLFILNNEKIILNKLKKLYNEQQGAIKDLISNMLNLKLRFNFISDPDFSKYYVVTKYCNIKNAKKFFCDNYGFIPIIHVADYYDHIDKIVENSYINIYPLPDSFDKKLYLYASNHYCDNFGFFKLINDINLYDNNNNIVIDKNVIKDFEREFIREKTEYALDYNDFINNLDKISTTYKYIGDKESKYIYSSVMMMKLTGHTGYLIQSNDLQYYHPKVHAVQGDIVIDGGCIEDELDVRIKFPETVGASGHVYGFDPYYKALADSEMPKNLTVTAKALHSGANTLYFNYIPFCSYGLPDQREGGEAVPATTIYDFVKENNIAPTVIKMDIEGGEVEALKGAKETIKRYRPKLMISVYHMPNIEYIDIPDIISSIADYKFYFRHSMPSFTETVLFGEPIIPFIELGFDLNRHIYVHESDGEKARIKGRCIFWNQNGERDKLALPTGLLATLDDKAVFESDDFLIDEEASKEFGREFAKCGFDIKIPGISKKAIKHLKLYARHVDGHYAQVNDYETSTEYSPLVVSDFMDKYRDGEYPSCAHLIPGALVLNPNIISACCNCGSGYGEEINLIYNVNETQFNNFTDENEFHKFIKVLNQRLNVYRNAVVKGWVPRCSHCSEKHCASSNEWERIHNEKKLDAITIGIDRHCQLRCEYCWQWKDPSYTDRPGYNYSNLLTQLVNHNYIDGRTFIAWTGGEPLLLKNNAKLHKEFSSVTNQQRFYSNSILFSEQIAELLSENKAILITSLDSWDRESYKKIHNRDHFELVRNNLARYASFSENAKNNLYIKYILTELNNKTENIESFIKLCKSIGIKNVLLSHDFNAMDQFIENTKSLYLFFQKKALGAGLSPHYHRLNDRLVKELSEAGVGPFSF